MGLKAKLRPKKCKKARYSIGNVIEKDLSRIIREFEKLPYKSYERRRPKHAPTNTYFYLVRQLTKCMLRADAINFHVYPVRTGMTTTTKHILISRVCSTKKSKLKGFLVDKTLPRNYSTDEDESKGIIVN